jgi:2-C-methyl-D-erythritol 2,4-cyclodiphosphate synthase
LLREVGVMLAAEDTVVVNIDATIVAERPRVSTYVETMRDNIAADLDISREQVNVKGTTTEQMGFTGREEGIAATAMVLLSAA